MKTEKEIIEMIVKDITRPLKVYYTYPQLNAVVYSNGYHKTLTKETFDKLFNKAWESVIGVKR